MFLSKKVKTENKSVVYHLGSQLELITPTQKTPIFRSPLQNEVKKTINEDHAAGMTDLKASGRTLRWIKRSDGRGLFKEILT